jgi:hypothetical protein
MYTHLGNGFYRQGLSDKKFRSLMERLSRKNGWFVPVSTLFGLLKKTKRRKNNFPHKKVATGIVLAGL